MTFFEQTFPPTILMGANNLSRIYTPTEDELMPGNLHQCPECQMCFKNFSQMNLHLERHHRVPRMINLLSNAQFLHCPVKHCIYNAGSANAKHFREIRNLRQHYRKVHAQKLKCPHCPVLVLTANQLCLHVTRDCNRKFTCLECGQDFFTLSALVTHSKRKKHKVGEDPTKIGKVAIARLPSKKVPKGLPRHQGTQTQDIEQVSAATQTVIDTSIDGKIDAWTNDITDDSEFNPTAFLDDMLDYPTNRYTQTCTDLLSGSVFAQTQTYWPDGERVSDDLAVSADDFDMFLVSTETQTSFSKQYLDACTSTNESEAAAVDKLALHEDACHKLISLTKRL